MLNAYRADFEQQASKEEVDAMKRTIAQLDGVERFGLQVGDALPHFSLSAIDGTTCDSKALLKKGPLVVQFFRGGRCPYCNLHLRALQHIYHDFQALNTTIIGVSSDWLDDMACVLQTAGITFPIVHDDSNKLAQQMGVCFRVDEKECIVPATFVVGQDGVIFTAFRNADFTVRKEPADVLEDVRTVMEDRKTMKQQHALEHEAPQSADICG
jgi:peroxiredoxin